MIVNDESVIRIRNAWIRARNTSKTFAYTLIATLGVVILLAILFEYSHYSTSFKYVVGTLANLSLPLLIVTYTVLFLGGAIKGVAGIGMGLVAVPLISIIYDPILAVCIIAVPLVITNFWQGVVKGATSSVLRTYFPIILSMTLAMICSGYFANLFSVSVLSVALGFMAILFALINLGVSLPRVTESMDLQLQITCGVTAGFVGGITGLVVIPLVFYMVIRNVSKEEFVSVLGLLFLISGLVLIFCYGLNGAMTFDLFLLSTFGAVPALLGVVVGEHIRQLINEQLFRSIALYLIMAIGMKLIMDAM